MPRAARLDAPGALHHVMVRGIERRVIFRDDQDRCDFLSRLGLSCGTTGARVLAWALLANHAHLLVRSGAHGVSALMRRLLTGYAGHFNRRHHRRGYVFQNRFKSILVEEDVYLLELVRYVHLNPLRAGIVCSLSELDRYPWTGHPQLLGRTARDWQAVDAVLVHFGRRVGAARRAYREFVAAGIARGRRPDLSGGGLRRSRAGWELYDRVKRGREHWAFDERVLGSSEFVQQVVGGAVAGSRTGKPPGLEAERLMAQLIRTTALQTGLGPALLSSGGKQRRVVALRRQVAATAVRVHGLPIAVVARALAVSPRTVLRGAELPSVAPLPNLNAAVPAIECPP